MQVSRLGRVGIWAHSSRLGATRARELEEQGYGAIWIGGSPGGDLGIVTEMLAATTTIVVATGVVNMWADDAHAIAAVQRRIEAQFPDRFLLGVGIGHPEATAEYHSPYRTMVEYLDVLDAEQVPADKRALAALGPRALRLAADRTLGAHPYLTTPEHTREARELLGDGVLLAPEQKLVVHDDPQVARTVARRTVADPYLELSNYSPACDGSVSPTPTSPTAAATGSSTRLSGTATPMPPPIGCTSISTRVPTTWRSRSWPRAPRPRCAVPRRCPRPWACGPSASGEVRVRPRHLDAVETDVDLLVVERDQCR